MSKAADTGTGEVRTGSHALAVLSTPLNGTLLQRLADRPMRLAELSRDRESAPPSTIRAHLKALEAKRLIARRSAGRSSELGGFAPTKAGRDLLDVAAALERWLLLCPHGALPLGSSAGKSAVKALAGGWSSGIVGMIARGRCSLSDLDRRIAELTYPTLARRVNEMHRAGQLEAGPGDGPGVFYEPTEWLRQAIAPLAAAVRWERSNLPRDTAPVERFDIETGFLLALPLLAMDAALAGSCQMVVEIEDVEEAPSCGATATVTGERVLSCVAGVLGDAGSWIAGPSASWVAAMTDGAPEHLELGGDEALARALLAGLRRELFGGAAEGASVA